jgi:hypothetical protein
VSTCAAGWTNTYNRLVASGGFLVKIVSQTLRHPPCEGKRSSPCSPMRAEFS